MVQWKMLMKCHFKQLFWMIIMTRHNIKCYGLIRYDKSQMMNGESYTALNICYQYWLRTKFQGRMNFYFPIMKMRAWSNTKKEKTQIWQMRHFWLHRCCTDVAQTLHRCCTDVAQMLHRCCTDVAHKALLNLIAQNLRMRHPIPNRIKQRSYERGTVF